MSQAQQKEVSNSKPANPTNRIIICAPSHSSLLKEPLYIIDDVVVNSRQFSKINANDIREIKVLKGNEATPIYGNKAINGAIVIITKENE